ncbi:TonB family protein [Inhella inkyongensis]|uniref:TonB family protein n=1 Tax=Inhella inkyongensis TaxID=392593 RepID=A0A840S075_9BURK|nr:TonB family protein [Inhella inkyongensis]MBB5203193.1 TonB family protein [Inhella inkyongensis]
MFRSNKTLLVSAAGLLMLSLGVQAQVSDAKKDAATLSDQARAQRDANKVLNFIRFHAVRPAAAPKLVARAEPEKDEVQAPRGPAAAASAPVTTVAQAEALLREAPPAGGSNKSSSPPDQTLPAPEVRPDLPPEAKPAPEGQPEPAVEPEPQPLQLIAHVDPQVPAQFQSQVRSGQVTVRFVVSPQGQVVKAEAKAGAQRRLAQAAVRAVEQWRFAPLSEAREAEVEIAFKFDSE